MTQFPQYNHKTIDRIFHPYGYQRLECPVRGVVYLPVNRLYKPLGYMSDVRVPYERFIASAYVFKQAPEDIQFAWAGDYVQEPADIEFAGPRADIRSIWCGNPQPKPGADFWPLYYDAPASVKKYHERVRWLHEHVIAY